MTTLSDTIAALATAPGAAGVAIVRLSGRSAWQVAARVAPSITSLSAVVGRFRHTTFHHPVSGERLDDGLLLVFRAPHSFTGEDVVELQGHGGQMAARRLLDAALAAGARLAAPGEFSRRAFLNGRLDLTQAEALLDLITARTDRAANTARAQLEGRLGSAIDQIYREVLAIAADVEALLDFDEEEIPADFQQTAASRLHAPRQQIDSLVATWHTGHLLRSGALVVISGRPNAGKSSLLNALLGSQRAIVSSTPGTTRDSIEEGFVLHGIPLRLVDTAGLRSTADEVEAEGVARARALVTQADFNLHLIDASIPLCDETLAQLQRLPPAGCLVLLNKSDLPSCIDTSRLAGYDYLHLSLRNGTGLRELQERLSERLQLESSAPVGLEVSQRHHCELMQTATALTAAHSLLQQQAGEALVLAAQELRTATQALGRITGRVWSDDLLDTIFSRFCVGK